MVRNELLINVVNHGFFVDDGGSVEDAVSKRFEKTFLMEIKSRLLESNLSASCSDICCLCIRRVSIFSWMGQWFEN